MCSDKQIAGLSAITSSSRIHLFGYIAHAISLFTEVQENTLLYNFIHVSVAKWQRK